MEIKEIFKLESADKIIQELKQGRNAPLPDLDKAIKALDPGKHDVNDKVLRPDKKVLIGSESNNPKEEDYRIERVARIRLALQKLIIGRSVSFCFGNPVAYNSTPENDNQLLVASVLKRILYDNKSDSLNRKVGRTIFGFTECAEIWYPVERANTDYGFNSKFKLRCLLFSPEKGDTLYPYWDDTGDMVAFSRSFNKTDSEGKRTEYFETYTDTAHWMWRRKDNAYEVVEGYPHEIAIGKIPVIYGRQEQPETQDVDSLIDRLEKLLSNFADTNDYHASPKIFIKGELRGFAKKGEAGAILEGDDNTEAKYLEWSHAPESVKMEIETLLRMIYTITQTPDISFESVKGLGAITGIALKLLFMDAHLKVQDKREIFDEYLQRRVNVIKAYIGMFNIALSKDCDVLEIHPKITPYMLDNEIEEINMWLAANGNKPLVSQKQSVKSANLSQDPDADYEQILEEASTANAFMTGEPTFA